MCIRSVGAAAVDEDEGGGGEGCKMLWEQRSAEKQEIREAL